MSDLQKINGQNGSQSAALPGQEEADYDLEQDFDETIEGDDEIQWEGEGVKGGNPQHAQDVTLDQILKLRDQVKDLQGKFSSQKNMAGKNEVLQILSDLDLAEHNEKFADAAHQDKAQREFDEAVQLYKKLSQDVANQESQKNQLGGIPSDLPDSIEGDQAIYNTNKNPGPHINIFGDPQIKTFDVKVQGTPTIHASSLNDKVAIKTNRPAQGKATIEVSQVDQEGKVTETKTLVVDYDAMLKIKFEGFDSKKNAKWNGKPYAAGIDRKIAFSGEGKDMSVLKDVQRIQRIIRSLDGGDNGSRTSMVLWQIARGFQTNNWKPAVQAIKDLKKEDGNNVVNLLVHAIKINYAVQEDSHLNLPQASIDSLNSGFLGAADGAYNTAKSAADFAWNTAMGHVTGGIFNFKTGDIGSAYDVEAGLKGAGDFFAKISLEVKNALVDKAMEETDRINRPDGIQEYYAMDDGSFMNSGKAVSADSLGLSRNAADSVDFINSTIDVGLSEEPTRDAEKASLDEEDETDAAEEAKTKE